MQLRCRGFNKGISCGHLLGVAKKGECEIEIKCPKCKTFNTYKITTTEQQTDCPVPQKAGRFSYALKTCSYLNKM